MNTEPAPFRSEVEPLRCQYEAWRQTRKQGEHIPESLWEAAARLAGAFGVGRVSRALGVGYYALRERVQGVLSVNLCDERKGGDKWAAQPRRTGVSQCPDRKANKEIQLELAVGSAAW